MGARVGTWTDCQPFALEGNLRLGQCPAHHFEAFHKSPMPLLYRDPESRELEWTESRPHTDHDPALAQMVHPTDLLGQPQWMVQWHDRDAVADADPLRPLRNSGRVDRWRTDRS